ncbi:50S ribosomal protein L13 [Candidatus Peregrinibacteria bacterium CG08_land_8_20_14_0_20_41_10]|nr:MAG: 50S ribosomal protein L13 [Candidatus Peregrinibacteria bacterium CG1_02_41_10]PIS32223.1 MAG: 50S ribosomal protein L13 [Candidatus Peregrinibacteria bacterium CG08_land_8_20_14_0_20_41_10]
MKTFIPKVLAALEHKWYLIDAEDQILGRLAVKVADLLRGKNLPQFTPHMNMGGYVVVINAEKIKTTGNNKEIEKTYFRHSGYKGSEENITLQTMRAKKPTEVIRLAVRGMLPKNRLRDDFLRNLKIFAGPVHPHTAQQPEQVKL